MSENNISPVPVSLTLRERFRLYYLTNQFILSNAEQRELEYLRLKLHRFRTYYYDYTSTDNVISAINSIDQAVIRRHTHTRNPELQPIQELIDSYHSQDLFPDSFEFAMDPNAHHILQDLADEHKNHPDEHGESELEYINRRHTEEIQDRQEEIRRAAALQSLITFSRSRSSFSVPESPATLQLDADANNQITTPIATRRSRRRQNQIQAPPAPVRRSQRRRLNIQQEEEKEREEKKDEEKEEGTGIFKSHQLNKIKLNQVHSLINQAAQISHYHIKSRAYNKK